MAAYGIDSLDPAVTPRRVAVLMANLPPSARGGGEAWSTEAELLAVLCDQLSALTYVTLRAAGVKNVPRPKPVPRPGRPAPREPGAEGAKHGSWADAAAALAGMPGMVTDRGDLCVRRAGDPGHR
jgi:hypothetical protein